MLPPTFAQPERRSFFVPVVIAIAILAAAIWVLHRTTTTSLSASLNHTEVLPNTTVYKSDTIVVGPPETVYTLFVVSTLRIDNKRAQPVSVDDLVLTLTDPTGAQLTAQALRPAELANAEASFPKLRSLVDAPLLQRETPIAPDQSAQGIAVFSLAVPRSVWDTRKSATIVLMPYRLDPLNLTIPK